MDSIISLGHKNTLAEYMILSGADNRPPMLDKDLYDSWKIQMELYMQNKEHERMIIKSVEHGPLIWPTVEENGVIRTKKYAELFVAEKIQADCDMKATNIILQGLPADIYLLERERKMYDAFDKFTHIKRELLHTYYLRFTQMINDMNIYKINMEQFQVNTKFLNSLPLEWSKFVTDVKLVKDLHTSNYDQLHAYLEQHELHANEVRIIRERNQDPLAFVANQQMTPPHYNTYQSSYNNPQLQQQFSPSQQGSIQPTQHYSSHYPSQTQFNHSSIPPSHTFQSHMNYQTSNVPQDIWLVNALSLSGQGMHHDPRIPAGQAQTINPHNAAFQTEDLDTYDSDCDDLSNAQAVLMANISNYASGIILEVPNSETNLNDMDNQSVHALQDLEQLPVMKFTDNEISSDSNIIPYSRYLQETHQATVQDTDLQAQQDSMILFVIEQILTDDFGKRFTPQQELSAEQAFWLRISNPSIESSLPPVRVEVPSELPKVSLVDESLKKLKFQLAQFNSVVKKRTTPNALTEGECRFEHTKDAFNNEIIPFLKSLKTIFNVFDKDLLNEITEVKTVFDQMEAAVQQSSVDKQCLEIANKELLLKNDRLSQQIMSQDIISTVMHSMYLNVDCMNVGIRRSESCEKCLNLDVEFSKSKQEYNDLLKKYSQLEKHCISLKVSMQLKQEVFQNDESCVYQNAPEIPEYFKKIDLKAQLKDKDMTICKLKDTIKSLRKNNKEEIVDHDRFDLATINGELENSVAKLLSENERKAIIDNAAPVPSAITVAPGMFKLDLKSLAPKLVHNRECHSYYLKHTQEQADILRGIFEQAKAQQPLDNALDFACKHAKRIQELLVYVRDTCPSAVKLSCSDCTLVSGLRMFETHERESLTVRFENDKIARIMEYGDYQLGNVIISRKNTYFIPNLEGVDLLSRSRDTNLYIISLDDMLKSSPTSCALGKSKKSSHQPKDEDTNKEKLYLLHMDLCGPIRVASINEKRYILVIVDDYSRFTWVRFLKTKDEAPAAIIKFIKNIQVHLNARVRNVRTDNGTEFVNQTLREFYKHVGISNQTSVARTPQQNGVVERRNRTLVKAAQTMLIFSKASLFLCIRMEILIGLVALLRKMVLSKGEIELLLKPLKKC
nr:hypothetical protein [Tanacetum cinerariifolium]